MSTCYEEAAGTQSA
jgi:predicted peroxiredoxin